MKFTVALLTTILSVQSFAGDKIGNGGGLWACRNSLGQLQSAELVDLYEAREEFGLTLITPRPEHNAKAIFADRKETLNRVLPELSRNLSPVIKEVEMKIRFVSAQLEIIEDALYRVRPLPQTCPTVWVYEQFANYSHQGQVLIRKDLWDDATVQPIDRAALLWHEIIYRYLRVNASDADSVRARQIVGILFSKVSDSEMRFSINQILGSVTPPPPPPPQNTRGWICTIYNSLASNFHVGYGEAKIEATATAENSCGRDNSLVHCRDLKCEKITSDQNTHICMTEHRLNSKSHLGKGRNLIEAIFNSQKACQGTEGGFHCAESQCELI